jgi:hypothetical protein
MTQRIATLIVYVLGLLAMLPQLIALVLVSWVAWEIVPVAAKVILTVLRLF